MNTDPGRSPSIVTSIADWGNLFKGRVGPVCVKKFSVKPSSQYRYSFMSESEECRAWARRGHTTGVSPDVRVSDPNDVGVRRRQTRPGRPEGKNFYTHTPARALRREGRPVRPWREAHSLSPCPVGQRQRLRTRKPNTIARVLHPRSDNTRCCPADSSWACPPSSRGIDVYPQRVPA